MPETPSFSIGIEEEYQIIDPQTRELKSYITELLEAGKMTLREQVKAELHQSIVEVGTKVCHSAAEAREELIHLRKGVMELAGRSGLKIAAAGTHPFSSWMEQEITPIERYAGVKQDMQILAQQLLIFGTHVHIGIEDQDFLIDAMNVVRYFMPHSCHAALAITGSVAVATAAVTPGTLAHAVAGDRALPAMFAIEHPSGRLEVTLDHHPDYAEPAAYVVRTARRLFEGHVLVKASEIYLASSTAA